VTVREALAGAAQQLSSAGIENGRGEAELLLGRLLDAPRAELHLRGGEPFDTGTARTLGLWLLRRQGGEPIQYITGEAAYRDLVVAVGPGCFIPRPETELLVDEALAFLRDVPAPRVLEVCTGSGAIGLAIATERPDATVTLTELSPRALAYAARNRARLVTGAGAGATARVRLVQGDLAESLRGPFDALVANPPYVAEREREFLPRDVLDHEPGLALFAAEDGLATIRRLIDDAPRLVRPGGLVALELGEGQGDTVEKRFRAHGAYAEVRIRLDLAGKARMALATLGSDR
jgi:release factor glutamine methyltransferase